MIAATSGVGAALPGSASADPVLAAVGDIACTPGDTNHSHSCRQQATATLVAGQPHDAVALLGDIQYDQGLYSEFMGTAGAGGYNVSWGQFNPLVHPELGNHEYAASPSAAGYFQYFGNANVVDGGPNGWYSYDLGSWHIVALNSNCALGRAPACQNALAGATTQAEVSWLQGDLAAHQNQCILAYWHHPLFTSGTTAPTSSGVTPLWNVLYAAHADVVLNGHDHLYERFAPLDPSGSPTSQGIREFVVGTGGESLSTKNLSYPNMDASDDQDLGVLFLTLHPYGYDWTFRAAGAGTANAAAAGTVLDSSTSSAACHAQPPPAPVISHPVDQSFENTHTVALSGTAEANNTINVYDASAFAGSATADGNGAWSLTLSGVADGAHSYSATATDAAGSTSPASGATHITVDTVAPTTSITSGPSGSTNQNGVSFAFSSSKAGSSFACELAGPGQWGGFAACASPTAYPNLADGSYAFTVRATDAAGNTDANPPTRGFSVLVPASAGGASAVSTGGGAGAGASGTGGNAPATGGGASGGGGPVAMVAMTSLGLSPPVFVAASSGPSASAASVNTGTVIIFALTQPGVVRFSVERPVGGRVVHGRCVAASRASRRAATCTRYTPVRGSFLGLGAAGTNRLRFSGRMAGKKLAAGRYRLVATPGAGQAKRRAFRVKQ